MQHLAVIFYRFLALFSVGFILTLPNTYFILPNTGTWFAPGITTFTQQLFGTRSALMHSDSLAMHRWVIVLAAISITLALVWYLWRPQRQAVFRYYFYRLAVYYLSLTLLIYGFNKLFNYQFFFPEPNTLYTPLGQLSPDILYWSSMGTSTSYSVFAGLIEIIPAILLLFKRTRMAGAFISLGVLTNVAMINFGFDITVKFYSLFLLVLVLMILAPYSKRLFQFFTSGEIVAPPSPDDTPTGQGHQKYYPILKSLLIGLLLFEGLAPYFSSGYFNGHNLPKPPLYGAYDVTDNPQGIKRVFIHSRGYFITQNQTDQFKDYVMTTMGSTLKLSNYSNETSIIHFTPQSADTYTVTGNLFGNVIQWQLHHLDLSVLPLSSAHFTWVAE